MMVDYDQVKEDFARKDARIAKLEKFNTNLMLNIIKVNRYDAHWTTGGGVIKSDDDGEFVYIDDIIELFEGMTND